MSSQFTIIIIAGLVLVSAMQAISAKEPDNLVTNPGFERKLDGWQQVGQAEFAADTDVKRTGKCSARITISQEQPLEYQHLSWAVPVKPGEEYAAAFWTRSHETTDGIGTYGVLEFYRNGKRLNVVQGAMTRSENWHQHMIEAKVPPDADEMRLGLILYAHGTAWFDDVRLTPVVPQPLLADFTLQSGKTITDNWQGFGFQGDLFLDRQSNIEQGMNDEDRELVEKRVLAMRPQVVRLLFQLDIWEAELGKHTPDSEGMKDLRRSLAIYQKAGADIHLTDWVWTPPAWAKPTGIIPHPDEVPAYTDSFAAAVKYLREDCGFKNIRYVTIYNEPNGGNFPWKDYVGIYRSLDRSLKDAGLRKDVAILGPDEANTYDWLPWSIAELNDVIDYYDAHNYTSDTGKQFAAWVAPRIADMPKLTSSGMKPPRKRLMITEFGMHDRMETFSTPHNGDYEYGMFLADSAIAAADKGASALMMWCVMDSYYFKDIRMKWGLWRFRDENWEPRPGFYSWSLITRYTERGSTVHPVTCSVEDAAAVAFQAPHKGPWTVLAVNRRMTERPFIIKGLPAESRWLPFIYSEKAIPTPDRQMIRPGTAIEADADGVLTGSMPPNSFLLWRQL